MTARNDKPPEPLPEVMLDKMIGALDGPLNRVAERVLSSKLVLAPLALSMTLGMRAYARLMGRSSNKKNGSPS